VLGLAQAVQGILEFGLRFLETLQRLLTVFVKGAIAARRPVVAAAFHAGAKALHLVLHPLHLLLPARGVAAVISCHATHSSAPKRKKEKGEADWPPHNETEHGQHDPARMPASFEECRTVSSPRSEERRVGKESA